MSKSHGIPINTKQQLIEYVKGFTCKESAFDAMKITQVGEELADWFYKNYTLKNMNKSQKDAFNDFYQEHIK